MGKERMLITGGHSLEGQVRVSGGKNTAVAVIPATLLCETGEGGLNLWSRYDSSRCDPVFMQKLAEGLRERMIRFL